MASSFFKAIIFLLKTTAALHVTTCQRRDREIPNRYIIFS
ncbi:hypothetical protein COLINT_02797 [Collinsella intestinalis DSM 13280]|uniref:Uncharacterized protein n=1 Tax=Collinsella intestinalis DSM 13280 TaxID=521003 RepID=C4F9R4_9ACTN|nr:hypothetical protein COLINT_02797 [Collinsella intestinalis DSM 13280]